MCPDAMLDDSADLERIALSAAQACHDRWQIETSFQTVKQEFALEKARVRTFKRLENLFSLCILAYVFATDHLRRTPGFRKVLKLLSGNLETVSTKPHALLAGIRALVGLAKVRSISGRPRKLHPPNPLQLLLALRPAATGTSLDRRLRRNGRTECAQCPPEPVGNALRGCPHPRDCFRPAFRLS